ncbi:MAG: hypothetical protein DRH24_16090, partial [Deltaproteobacteria bacterium]
EIGIHALDPARAEDREAMLAKFRAEREAEAVVVSAEATRKKIETEALGERRRLELIGEIVEQSPQRLAAYILMQVGKHPELAKAILVNLPSSLASVVANAFGAPSTQPQELIQAIKSVVSSEETTVKVLQEMKEALDKLIK